jgi:hypothetical protein
MTPAHEERTGRQNAIGAWVRRCFGQKIEKSPQERVRRLLEEATELAQAEDLREADAHGIVSYVFGRPKGEPRQEVGGVSITLLAYCHARGLNADECEIAELHRILSLPEEKFRKRMQEKSDAGVGMQMESGQ